jgi:hypothetical protein
MKKQRFTEEQIIVVLREQEAGALNRAGKAMQNGYVESFDGRMRDDLRKESLLFGRPSSIGYQSPADYAGFTTATRSNAERCGRYAFLPFCGPPTAPSGT